MEYLEDDSVVGNSDRMLFHSKELVASQDTRSMAHNPFVISKLEIDEMSKFDFSQFQGYIDSGDKFGKQPNQDDSVQKKVTN